MDSTQSAGPLEIEARMRVSSLIGIIFLEGVYAYFMVFSVVACLHPGRRPYANDVVLGLLAVFLCSMLVLASRVPYKTMLSGDMLTTYSLRGKKRISIHNVAMVKPVIFLVSKGNGLWCLKLKENTGQILFLQLGTLSRHDRLRFHDPLTKALHPEAWPERANWLWQRWYSARTGVTVTKTTMTIPRQ